MKEKILFFAVLIVGLIACSVSNVSAQRAARNETGVVINGVRWATRNVDAPGTFAATPTSFGMLYQWNTRVGWSTTDPMVNSNGGTTWSSVIPTGTTWETQNDPCPRGWRVPTRDEIISLRDAGHVLTTIDGVLGQLFGTAPNQVFLPAAGWRVNGEGGALQSVNAVGEYWNSLYYDEGTAWGMFFNKGGSMSVGIFNNRAHAMSVRCVAR